MNISDELKHSIDLIVDRGPDLNLSHLMGKVKIAIPGIITLEKSKELLEHFRWRSTPLGEVCQGCHEYRSRGRHYDGCEIAKVLD